MKLLFSINSLLICGSIFQLLFDKYENQLSVLINYLIITLLLSFIYFERI